MGVAEKNGGDREGGQATDGEIRWDKVGPIDVEPGQKVEVHQVMDAAGVAVLEELLIKETILAEVLAEIEEYAFSLLLQVDLIAADAVSPVVNCERCDFVLPPLLSSNANEDANEAI
jgi:hypothetical protein